MNEEMIVELAITIFMVGVLALLFISLGIAVIANWITKRKRAAWLAARRRKTALEILSPASAKRRVISPQVRKVVSNGQQEVEQNITDTVKDILNMARRQADE